MLAENLARVEERIANACAQAGRQRSEITLIAVTKVFPVDVIRQAYALGLREFGENYVQEFEGKQPAVRDLPEARFHLIGHLQSNKARRAAELFQVIQTVDTAKLGRRLSEVGNPLELMLEVKLSEEQSKSGVAPDSIDEVAAAVRACPGLTLTGLMTMPPWNDNPEVTRPYFARLRELGARHQLQNLSMGMSHDFEAAIQEGATHIRVGTALFGRRKKP